MSRTHVLVRARCWTCDGAQVREVVRRHRAHAHLSWYCATCEVGWTGPGEDAEG